ncbi:MAG TPA: bestrophin family ion channel, partial [Flavobacteriales bacterium]|nr:bestrophin family ion channel [Flavobacteriales bacterium]
MFVRKNLTFRSILVFSGGHLVWLVLWSVLVVALYEYAGAEWLSIPWVPLAVIGTAVAFYVGFKNNSAYDRLWEARKIWGAI